MIGGSVPHAGAMAKLTIELTTPERTVFKDTVDSATIPTSEGEITVLPGHVRLVSVLVPGALALRKGAEETLIAVSTGFIQVQGQDRILILADTAERATELEEARIEQAIAEAKERAKKAQEEKGRVEDQSFAEAAAAMERELARLRVARKHRSHGTPRTPSAE